MEAAEGKNLKSTLYFLSFCFKKCLLIFRIKRKDKSYEEIASILRMKINISDEDILSQYQDFQNCYPEGQITEQEFLEIFSNNAVFSPSSLFRYINSLQ